MRTGLVVVLLVVYFAGGACGARIAPSPQATPRPEPRPAEPPDPGEPPPPAPPRLAAPPSVRVVLTRAAAAGKARVEVKGAWTLVSGAGTTLRSGASISAELVTTGATVTLGGLDFPLDGELRPATEGDLRIDARTYPGTLRVERGPDARWRPMIATDIETYVGVVVNAEIPAAFPREAQRTQAILARTYALTSTVRTSPQAPLVLTDVGGSDQEFSGLAAVAEHRRIALDAARSTAGLVLTDSGAPFVAYYHSSCGGVTCPGPILFTQAAGVRALSGGIVCPWCATDNKYFKWDARIAGADVGKAAGLSGALEYFQITETTAGGRAVMFDIRAGGKVKRVKAADFRLRVGATALRSVLLDDASAVAGDLVVRGRGWGHGVGLCQMGARTLAEKGLTAEAILAIYYTGASLERRW